jgi:hypothetical protein
MNTSKFVSSFCVCAWFALTVASTASAAFIAYEPFDYSTGSLQGQTNPSNGLTWLRAGTSANPTAINVASGNLTVPQKVSTPIGNSATINGIGDGSGSTTRLALGQTITSGTVYYSFAFRADALTGSNNTIGGFFISFNNTGNTSQTTNPSVAPARIQSRIDPIDASKYDLGIFNVTATASATSWSSGLALGVTHFIVAGYTFNTGSATDDVASLWIDPDPSTLDTQTPPLPTVTGTGGDVAAPGISSILLRQSPAPFLTMDELRIGTDWGSVTTPEPGTTALMLVGCVVMPLLVRSRIGV